MRATPGPPAEVPEATAKSDKPLPAALPQTEIALAAPSDVWPQAPDKVTAFFSGTMREGIWTVPPRVRLRAIFGGVDLDLRRARFAEDVTEIHCSAIFGRVRVVVPPSVRLENHGGGFFGSFVHEKDTAGTNQDTKVVRVTGRAVFGGVKAEIEAP